VTTTEPDTKLKDGRVVTVAGPVVDVEFPRGAMPEINTCLSMTIDAPGGETIEVRAEVAQQIGDGRVRAICLKPTDGLTRGAAARPWSTPAPASPCPSATRCWGTCST